jgi:hypothetical protein
LCDGSFENIVRTLLSGLFWQTIFAPDDEESPVNRRT